MTLFFKRYKYQLLITLILFVSELIVKPLGEFPLNDDWAYTKSLLILLNQGVIDIGSWCGMSLMSHLVWGWVFAKAFGFSFFILRLSTLISALIGALFFYELIKRISSNQHLALAASLLLLFNPVSFVTANTFMTDVTFNSWMIVLIYYVYRYFDNQKLIYVALITILSAALVLNRQLGIIFPFCFIVSCFFTNHKRWFAITAAIIGFVAVYVTFRYYENYLTGILPNPSNYRFSSAIGYTSSEFWRAFFYQFFLRYQSVILNLLFFTAPFLLLFMRSVIKKSGYITITIWAISSLAISLLCLEVKFPEGNVFTLHNLGAETFYNNTNPNNTDRELNVLVIRGLKIIFPALSIFVLSAFLFSNTRQLLRRLQRPEIVFLISVTVFYLLLLFSSISYFERYLIPIITIFIILFSYFHKRFSSQFGWQLIPLFIFMWIAILGTKDYFTLNRLKWEAVDSVRKQEHVDLSVVNAGFEINCWDDGKYTWWTNYGDLEPYKYLVQYQMEPGFRLYKAFEFQRYYPYKKDKINIFVRDTIK